MALEKTKKKAQAAVFDGIMFLLLVSFSAALVYSFVSIYGNAEDTALRSSYELNYLQSVVKTIYFINAVNLKDVRASDSPNGPEIQAHTASPSLSDETNGCASLANYPGTLSVVDLIKKDLADPEPIIFDDKFGPTVPMPGKMALRCAAKELLKPFAYSSYNYIIEVTKASPTSGNLEPVPVQGGNATNVFQGVNSCDDAQKAGEKLFAVDSPFRVFIPPQENIGSATDDLILRVCVWPKRPSS